MCTCLPKEAVAKLCDNIQYTGWVCTTCRTENGQKIANLQIAVTQLSEKLSDVLVKVEKLENQSVIMHTPNHGVPDVTTEVYKSLADVNRRKSNIVVSGLPEPPASSTNGANDPVNHDSDRKAFESLCEEFFYKT